MFEKHRRATACVVVILALSWGCARTSVQTRAASLRVDSEPAGAEVWLDDGRVRILLGQTPLEVEVPYQAEVVDFDERHWLWLIPPVVLMAVGGGLMGDKGSGGDIGAELGGKLIGVPLLSAGGLSALGMLIGFMVQGAREKETPAPGRFEVGACWGGQESPPAPLQLGPILPEFYFKQPVSPPEVPATTESDSAKPDAL
ncbi:MAG TPA: hypothetical protein PK668_27640 [Myxococcota bacterium]|nr:hypothetical protein [Myxococcota bacterium]HRY95442.1 hypothetical protein [Myxococcota bacterium]HSA23506.1 hypothetical protein [Myxococcota bacterium]